MVLGYHIKEHHHKHHHTQQHGKGDKGIAPGILAVLRIAVFASQHGQHHVEGLGDGTVVVSFAQGANHVVVDNALAEHIGQGPFDPVAGGDGHRTPVLVDSLALDEDDNSVVELLLPHAPLLAEALGGGILVVALDSGGDDDDHLVRCAVVEGHEALLQRLALGHGQDARIVVHQAVALLGQPLGMRRYRHRRHQHQQNANNPQTRHLP